MPGAGDGARLLLWLLSWGKNWVTRGDLERTALVDWGRRAVLGIRRHPQLQA